MQNSKLYLILFAIISTIIAVVSYVLYNKINDLRDYFLQRLYNYEINIKEKFDNIQETYNNLNTVVPQTNEVEAKQSLEATKWA